MTNPFMVSIHMNRNNEMNLFHTDTNTGKSPMPSQLQPILKNKYKKVQLILSVHMQN
jgi:hypothetical protein